MPNIEKIYSQEQLAWLVAEKKSQKRKVIFTNGCFDILHPGHLKLIKEAKLLGDFLIIGLNSDDSIKRLKGPSRPVFPERVRAENLAQLPEVDAVVIFNEDTPIETIRILKPNLHLKGGDYREQDLIEAEAVKAAGGEIKIIPLLPGVSTTDLLELFSRDDQLSFYLFANSPGEVAGFVKPVLKQLNRFFPAAKKIGVLLPCLFSTGEEKKVMESLGGFTEIIHSKDYFSLWKSKPEKAVLLHFGGEFFYSALLARQWKAPLFSYQWANNLFDRYFTAYFVRDEKNRRRLVSQGINSRKIIFVGDLVADEVMDRLYEAPETVEAAGSPRIMFLPGSRLRELKGMVPLFLRTAEVVKEVFPHSGFSLLLSPFLPQAELEAWWKEIKPLPKLGGVEGSFAEGKIISAGGAEIRLTREFAEAQSIDLAISIPGTKTAEMAIIGKPLLVVLPLNQPEDIPFFGLVGLLDIIPVWGPKLKGRFLLEISKRFGFVSQPNILAQQAVVPELFKKINPDEIGEKAVEMLKDPALLQVTSRRLKELYSDSIYSAQRLVYNLLIFLAQGDKNGNSRA